MPNDMIDRLRSAANAIDERSGDYEMHYLLLEAAIELEKMRSKFNPDWSLESAAAESIREHQQIIKGLQQEVNDLSAKETDYCSHIADVDKKVYQLEAQNGRLRVALWQALQGWEYDGISDEHGSVYRECDKRSKESPTQSLAEIQAQAVESLLSDLRRDTADTNPARHIFQRMQLRVDVLRQSVKKPITNPSEISSQLVDGASNKQEQQP
jgi:hypothetical protein